MSALLMAITRGIFLGCDQFCNPQIATEIGTGALNSFHAWLQSGYPCLSLHGGKDQSDRESTISDFKSNVCNVLVATSVAARGLDVKDLVRPRPPPPTVAPLGRVALVCHGTWVAHIRHSSRPQRPRVRQ